MSIKMKKAQSVIMYAVLAFMLGMIILTSIFFLSESIRKSNSEEMAILLSDTILAKVENRILDIKSVAKFSDSQVRAIVELPNRLGGKEYSIVGGGRYLRIRIFSADPISRSRKIGKNISTSGVSYPPNMEIIYDPFTNSVTIK